MTEPQNPQARQDELQESMFKLELIKTQLEGLSQQGELFEITTNELIRARETLTNIKELPSDKEILIPIGGDVFIYSTVSDVKKVLISIGSGTMIEDETENAIEKLDNRLVNLTQTNQNILQTISRLQQQAQDLSMKIQELSREMQGQVNPNVSGSP